jgi:hypothetical protein
MMSSKSMVEIADRMSRRRAIVVAVAAVWFLGVQWISRPFFREAAGTADGARIDWWAVNAVVLLLGLATGGGLLNRRQLRALVNDEVSRSHYRTAVIVGYWIAMVVAMALYAVPGFRDLSGRETVYLIVTPSISLALLAFSFLEIRAHRDA